VKEAEVSGAETVDALRAGLEKINEKVASAEEKLSSLLPQKSTDVVENSKESTKNETPKMDAAALAIAKAQEKAASMSSLSESEKRQASLNSLKTRQQKAQARLSAAEEAGDNTVEALRSGLEKINEKIVRAEQQLTHLNPDDTAK